MIPPYPLGRSETKANFDHPAGGPCDVTWEWRTQNGPGRWLCWAGEAVWWSPLGGCLVALFGWKGPRLAMTAAICEVVQVTITQLRLLHYHLGFFVFFCTNADQTLSVIYIS